MINHVLVVCVGNICRSPYGEHVFRELAEQAKSATQISSAGIRAMVGYRADTDTMMLAAQEGLDLSAHRARQFERGLGSAADLILVMEEGHRKAIMEGCPELGGRTMLLDHWTGKADIADPYRRSIDFHKAIQKHVRHACEAWSHRIWTTNRK